MEDPDPDTLASRPEPHVESPVSRTALNAMTRAVTSLRNQVARLISTAPPLDQIAEEPVVLSEPDPVNSELNP